MIAVMGGVLLAGLIAAPQAPDEKKVLELIGRLDHDDVNVRSEAEDALWEMGKEVIPFLEKAREGAGAEARLRLERLVSELKLPERWARELLEETEPHQAYQRVNGAIQSGELMKRHLPPLFTLVFLDEETNDQLKQYLYSLARRHKVRGIWPALIELATRNDQDANYVYSHFQQCRPPKEAAGAILKALPKIHGYPAAQFLQLAVRLDPDPAKVDAAMKDMLESDVDDTVLNNLFNAVAQGSVKVSLRTAILFWERRTFHHTSARQALMRTAPDESVDEVIAWLDSPREEDVQMAAEYAMRHNLARAGRPLVEAIGRCAAINQTRTQLLGALRSVGFEDLARKWLASPEGAPAPETLLGLAGELRLKGLAPEVKKLLRDPEPDVRAAACRAVGDLRVEDAVGELGERLGDRNMAVRREALRALARIQGAEATATVLEQYRSGHPDVQAQAVELMPLMDVEAVLGELTSEEGFARPLARQGLATLVAHLGEPMLHRILARLGDKLSLEEFEAQVRLIRATR